MASRPGRTGRPWREVSARVYREEARCWLCGGYVDQSLPSTHRMSRAADHLVQLMHGGSPLDRSNLRLSHLSCNTSRSNRLRHVPVGHCACSLGMPCGRVVPDRRRGYVSVDPEDV